MDSHSNSQCSFFCEKVEYLGFNISRGKISVNPQKVEAITKFQPPTTLVGLQRFLGMVGWYRRFIEGFATIAAPLHKLLSKSTEQTEWQIHIQGSQQNMAFEN